MYFISVFYLSGFICKCVEYVISKSILLLVAAINLYHMLPILNLYTYGEIILNAHMYNGTMVNGILYTKY